MNERRRRGVDRDGVIHIRNDWKPRAMGTATSVAWCQPYDIRLTRLFGNNVPATCLFCAVDVEPDPPF